MLFKSFKNKTLKNVLGLAQFSAFAMNALCIIVSVRRYTLDNFPCNVELLAIYVCCIVVVNAFRFLYLRTSFLNNICTNCFEYLYGVCVFLYRYVLRIINVYHHMVYKNKTSVEEVPNDDDNDLQVWKGLVEETKEIPEVEPEGSLLLVL